IDIVRLRVQSLLEELARIDHRAGSRGAIADCPRAHDEVNGFGAPGSLALSAPCLDFGHLQSNRARKAANDLVLGPKTAPSPSVESLCPDSAPGTGIDESCVYADLFAIEKHASLQHVAHVKLVLEPLEVDSLPFVCEGRFTRDHETAGQCPR